jgi:uncharacterized protein (DUF1697 family)
MTRYAVLLRGVNVGGNKKIAMADLRAVLVGLGHEDVSTLLQSGNAVLTASDTDPRRLGARIEAALATELGLSSKVLVRTHAQLAAVIDANPFPTAEAAPARHLVQFLLDPLTAADRARIAEFDAPAFAPEEFRIGEGVSLGDGVVYFHLPGGIGTSRLAVAFGKHLSATTVMTGRNWNTVRKLRDLTG